MLVHGKTASGKTAASITMDRPMLHINREPKDPREIHCQLPGWDPNTITYVEPEDFDDMLKMLNDLATQAEEGKCKFKSIYHDGLTFGNTNYKQSVEDDRNEVRKASKNDADKLGMYIRRFDKEQKDYSVIASMMARETYLLNRISKFGIVVVSTAQSMEYPKWNKSVRIAPSLVGQEFPKLIHGYFSYIGYVVQPFRIDIVDGVAVPVVPRVSFVAHEDDVGESYLARCSCTRLAEAEARGDYPPLNYAKIMKVIRG
jgi:hypothetical protein